MALAVMGPWRGTRHGGGNVAFEMLGFGESPVNATSQSVKDLAQTPTLVVCGTADWVVPPAMGRTYRERMPNCHYVLVYDAGHAVAEERPGALSSTIIDFLDLRETFIVSRRDGRIHP